MRSEGPFDGMVNIDLKTLILESLLRICLANLTNLNFLKAMIFTRFDTPRAIINDGGTYFHNKTFVTLLKKNTTSHIESLHLITHKLQGKLKLVTGRSRQFWKG